MTVVAPQFLFGNQAWSQTFLNPVYTRYTEQGWANSKRSILERVLFEQGCPGEATAGFQAGKVSFKDSIYSGCLPPRGLQAEMVQFVSALGLSRLWSGEPSAASSPGPSSLSPNANTSASAASSGKSLPARLDRSPAARPPPRQHPPLRAARPSRCSLQP